MRKIILILFFSHLVDAVAQQPIDSFNPFRYPFYIGVEGGYGSTTWEGLVPSPSKQNDAISVSTPIEVREGGGVWGFFAGYEVTPHFAIEANYMSYPNASIVFDEESLFAYDHDERTTFDTHTQTISLMGKLMVFIPHTNVRVYSGAGIAGVFRKDEIVDQWRASPTFGLGFNYNFTEHLLAELAFNYTAGYGESELNPAESFVPFLYAGFFRLAYRF